MESIRKTYGKYFLTAWIVLAFLMLCVTAMPVHADETVRTNVTYLDRSSGRNEKKNCPEAIDLSTVSGNSIGNGKWYAVRERVIRNSRLKISGECNLILCDDSRLVCYEGISCNRGSTLNIYAADTYDSGVLTCDLSSEDGDAAIGGDEGSSGGTINIHGGTIYAENNCYGAAIGGGKEGHSGFITIYGGRIEAKGGLNAAAIGGGLEGCVENIAIRGGDVKATARGSYWSHNSELTGYAAAIGSGSDKNQGGNISIYGGVVKAESVNGAGIGSSQGKNAGEIFICGGEVTASSVNGAGIGGGRYGNGGETIITGGSIGAMSMDKGAGIGGGEKGSGGYVYVDGGKVVATGGKINVKFLDALKYENYGQGWGRENPGWNVIASLINAIFKSGEYGGAGIGGGHNGRGAEVVILGGEVIANAGSSSARAIGGGIGKQGGSLRLYDKACVMTTSDTSDENSLALVLSEQRIESARTNPYVHIFPCVHPDGYSYSYIDKDGNIDKEYHTFSCKYCAGNNTAKERHDFDENGDCICRYGIYSVGLLPNNSLGESALSISVSKGEEYSVPECPFTAPEGTVFSHWLVKYMSNEYPDREAVSGETLKAPTSGRIVLVAQWVKAYDVWVGGIRVTEGNRNNILGDDGSAVYTPGEDHEGTLTLNSPNALAKDYANALIYAENTDLTIEGTAVIRSANDVENGIRVKDGSLTILTKDLEVYGSKTGITVENGNLQVAEGTQRVYAKGAAAAILARNGIRIERGLDIVIPEDGVTGQTAVDGEDLFTIQGPETDDPAGEAEIKASLYTVTWKPGYEGKEPVTEQVRAWDEIMIPPADDERISFRHPDGQVFFGWKEETSGETFAPGDSFTVKDNVSFTAQWASAFPIWVNGVQVTAENMTDVLKDHTVIYDPDTATLKLNDPTKMDAVGKLESWIYADGIDLTIEGRAEINVNGLWESEGIVVENGGSLTLRTDSLSIHSASYGIYVEDGDLSIRSGTVTVNANGSYGIYIDGGSLNIEDDNERGSTITRVEVNSTNTIDGAAALRCFIGDVRIGDTLEITEPENGVVDRTNKSANWYSYMDERKEDRAKHMIITRRQDDPDDPDNPDDPVDPPALYRVIYSVSGAIPPDYLDPDPQDLKAGTEATVADSPATAEGERDGIPGTYSFDGWHAPEGITVVNGHFLMPEFDVVFTGRWRFTPAQYTVTFVDEDETTLLSPKKYEYGTPANNISRPQPPYKKADEQYRYTFAGWDPPLADVTEDVTYRATYTASERSADDEECTVSFNSAGGTEVSPQQVKKWGTAAEPEEPTREGYLFGTWTLDGSAYDFNTPVTEDITLTAVWEPLDSSGDGDYQVTDVVENHVYEIYQIFTGDYAEIANAEEEGTHPVLTNIVWGENGMIPDGVSIGDPVSQDILQALYAVKDLELDSAKLAEIENYVDFRSDPIRTLEIQGTDPVSVNLPAGYYLIRDKNGTQTGQYDAYTKYIAVIVKDYTIAPKSTKPSVDKQVSDNENHFEGTSAENLTNINPGVDGFYESADHAIHETFQFKLTAMLPASGRYVDYDEYKLVFHDTMSSGVTFEGIESVTMAGRNLEYVYDGVRPGDSGKTWTLTVVLPKSDDNTYRYLDGGARVEVIYNAHLNENAIAHNASTENTITNSNSVYLEYSNNPNTDINPQEDYKDNMGRTGSDTVWVFTYMIESMKKADSEEGPPLPGAGFTLLNGQTAVKLYDRGNGSYILADQTAEQGFVTEMVSNADGVFNLCGLDVGTYTLRETNVPDGYNSCEDTVVTITASHAENDSTAGADLNLGNTRLKYTIVNTSGVKLPSTGGPGTRTVRLAGMLLALGAGILLITRRRMRTGE